MLFIDVSRTPLLASLVLVAIILSYRVLSLGTSKTRVHSPTNRLNYTTMLISYQKAVLATIPKDDKPKEQPDKEAYYAITPLRDFDWRETKPIKIRPFKPKYHLTMGQRHPLRLLSEMKD